MEESYKNINSGVEADENRKTKYLQSIKDKRLQSSLARRGQIISAVQVSNHCKFLLYMNVKCPFVKKLLNIKLSVANYTRAVYTFFKVFNDALQRNIHINFKFHDDYNNDSGPQILRLQSVLHAYIKFSILPEMNIDEYSSDLEKNIYFALETFKSFTRDSLIADSTEISDTVNYLVAHSEYLEMSKTFNDVKHQELRILDYTIQLPSDINPPGIFTNLDDVINTNIVTDDELQNSFNIDSDPNCFVYMYNLFGNSNNIGTEKIEI